MRVSIVGIGYVGLVSGACLAEVGHTCICVDIDLSKMKRIKSGAGPIHEDGLAPLLKRLVGNRLTASADLRSAVLETEMTMIAVGTPFGGDRIDLSYIRQVASDIGHALRHKETYHVVAVKSTVIPGTTDDVVRPILEETSGKRAGMDFGLGMNPEFLTEGVAIQDFMRPDRIVLGWHRRRGRTTCSVACMRRSPPCRSIRTNNKTAEMIKYASNPCPGDADFVLKRNRRSVRNAVGDVDGAEVMRGVHESHYFTCDARGCAAACERRYRELPRRRLWIRRKLPAQGRHGARGARAVCMAQPMDVLACRLKVNESRQPASSACSKSTFPDLGRTTRYRSRAGVQARHGRCA